MVHLFSYGVSDAPFWKNRVYCKTLAYYYHLLGFSYIEWWGLKLEPGSVLLFGHAAVGDCLPAATLAASVTS